MAEQQNDASRRPNDAGPTRRHTVGVKVNSLQDFHAHSRLHFIGQWKTKAFDVLKAMYLESAAVPPEDHSRRYCRVFQDTLPQSAARNPQRPAWTSEGPSRGQGKGAPVGVNPHSRITYIHLDMDAFFCAVALSKTENEQYKNQPVAIGSSGSIHSDISSCNYIARRQYGVHAGMWMAKAKEKCPTLITLGYDFPLCEEIMIKLYELILSTSPKEVKMWMQVYSIDEVVMALHTVDEEVVENWTKLLHAQVPLVCHGCTASIGVGPNILLARLATAKAKPNGCYRVSWDEGVASQFIASTPVKELHGIGCATWEKIKAKFIQRFPSVAAETYGLVPRESKDKARSQEKKEVNSRKRKRGGGEGHSNMLNDMEADTRREVEVEERGAKCTTYHHVSRMISEEQDDVEKAPIVQQDSDDDDASSSYHPFLCATLQKMSLQDLQQCLGRKQGENIYEFCRGIDKRVISPTGVDAQVIQQCSGGADGSRLTTTEKNTTTLPQQQFAKGTTASVVSKLIPGSVGCTMSYAVRLQSFNDLTTLFEQLARDVCRKLVRHSAQCHSLRVTVMERHPDAPPATTKFLGCGRCNEYHFSAKAMRPGGRAGLSGDEPEKLDRIIASILMGLVAAGPCQSAVGAMTTTGLKKTMKLEDIRGVGLMANSLTSLGDDNTGQRSAAAEQVSLTALFREHQQDDDDGVEIYEKSVTPHANQQQNKHSNTGKEEEDLSCCRIRCALDVTNWMARRQIEFFVASSSSSAILLAMPCCSLLETLNRGQKKKPYCHDHQQDLITAATTTSRIWNEILTFAPQLPFQDIIGLAMILSREFIRIVLLGVKEEVIEIGEGGQEQTRNKRRHHPLENSTGNNDQQNIQGSLLNQYGAFLQQIRALITVGLIGRINSLLSTSVSILVPVRTLLRMALLTGSQVHMHLCENENKKKKWTAHGEMKQGESTTTTSSFGQDYAMLFHSQLYTPIQKMVEMKMQR